MPDFQTEEFNIYKSVEWVHLMFLSVIVFFILGQATRVQVLKIMRARQRLIHVEVRKYSEYVSRTRAKKNLKSVLSFRLGHPKFDAE